MLARLEKEVVHARSLVVKKEREQGAVKQGEKETTVLSRVIEREETKIMKALITELKRAGWETTTLIHDEVILDPKRPANERAIEKNAIEIAVKKVLRDEEEERGWQAGLLKANVSIL